MAELTDAQIQVDLDDWGVGGESIATPEPPEKTVLSTTKETQPGLDEDIEVKKPGSETPALNDPEVKEFLDNFDNEGDEDSKEPKSTGRSKTDKNALVELLKEEIEAGTMFAYDDFDESKQSLDEYLTGLSLKDAKELLKENVKTREQKVAETAPGQILQALPEKLQVAVRYALEGGTDIEGIFSVLGQVQKVNNLDPESETDQEHIVRNYLQAKEFGTPEEIEAEITDLKDLGKLGDRAKSFKPKLDQLQEQLVQSKLAQQEEANRQRQAAYQSYTKNVVDALKPGDLNGLKLDVRDQEMIYSGLTQMNHQSIITGRPTNEFGSLLEKLQFGETANYKLLSEVYLHMKDPEGYRNKILQLGKNMGTEEAVKTLKMNQGTSTGSIAEPGYEDSRRTTKKPTIQREKPSFFARPK